MEPITDNQIVKTKKIYCDYCKVYNNYKGCGACNSAFYCCKECQTKDWPKHKSICKEIVKNKERLNINCDKNMISKFNFTIKLNIILLATLCQNIIENEYNNYYLNIIMEYKFENNGIKILNYNRKPIEQIKDNINEENINNFDFDSLILEEVDYKKYLIHFVVYYDEILVMEEVLPYKVEKSKTLETSLSNDEIIEAINSKKMNLKSK